MADIKVKFMHPTDGRLVDVDMDNGMTPTEVVPELIAGGFVASNPQGYNLAKKGGALIPANSSFASVGIESGDIIRVIPATDAGGGGGGPTRIHASGIPGLVKTESDSFTIRDIQRSPEALIMVANMFEDLQLRYDAQTRELEKEKLRSSGRLTATLLLLVSQVVLSIGGNLLTQNTAVGIAILGAGTLQALLASYLAFRK